MLPEHILSRHQRYANSGLWMTHRMAISASDRQMLNKSSYRELLNDACRQETKWYLVLQNSVRSQNSSSDADYQNTLTDPKHGKILFKSLAVVVYSSTYIVLESIKAMPGKARAYHAKSDMT